MWLKYFGKWTDTRGGEWGLRVWSNDDVEGEAVELELGSDPVEVEWSDSEDLFEVVRSSTAKINVVADDIITGLQPRNNREMVVEVLRGWLTWWVGVMSADVLTQGYDDGVRVVTYQAKDRLSVLDGVELTDATLWGTGRFGTVNLLQLLYEITTVLPMTWERWWFPVDVMPVFDGETVDIGDVADCRTLQLLEVSRYNFYTEGDGDKGEEDYERWSKSTYGDVLRGVCGAMGWVAVERGNELWFVNPAVSVRGGDYRAVELGDLRGWLTSGSAVTGGSARSVRTWASEDMVCGGADDEYSRYQGYRKVKVVAKNNSWGESVLELPGNDELKRVAVSQIMYQRLGDGAQYYMRYKVFDGRSWELGGVTEYGQTEGGGVIGVAPRVPQSGMGFCGMQMFASDSWSVARDVGATEGKRRYSYSDRLRLRMPVVAVTDLNVHFEEGLTENVVMVLRSRGPIAVRVGALVLGATVDWDMNDVGDKGFAIVPTERGMVDVAVDVADHESDSDLAPWGVNPMVALRVGNVWWDGEGWTDVESRFALPIDLGNGRITDTKVLGDDYNGAPLGVFMPVDRDLTGEVEFTVWMPGESVRESSDDVRLRNLYFSDLALTWVYDPDGTGEGVEMPSQHTYSVSMDNGYEAEREGVELTVTSVNDAGMAYSQLRNGTRGLTGLVSRVRERTGKMERLLVDEIAKQQGEAWTVKRLRVEVQEGLMPADVVTNDGVQYLALGRSVDTGEGTERLTLVEVRV